MYTLGKLATGLLGVVAAGVLAGAASAGPITFTASGLASSGGPISASATFAVSGTNLIITLTNTSTTNTDYDPPDLLSGLFFNIGGTPTLSTVSAALTAGSAFVEGSLPAGANLGNYWQYKKSATGFTNGTFTTTDHYGIGAAGFGGIFGGGSGLAGGYFAAGGTSSKINGLDYSIVGDDFASAAHNGGVTGHGPFIDDSITFTLSGLPSGFDPSAVISDVVFAYGTAPDGSIAGCGGTCLTLITTPEPGTLAGIGTGLSLMGFTFRRRREHV